jgi:dihydrofolate reductase
MRRVIYSMMVTLDVCIAGPDGDLNWGAVDEELHTFVNQKDRQVGGHLYGRRTYQVMNDFWAAPTAEDPSQPEFIREYAQIWRAMPKVVFSRTLESVGDNAVLVRDNAAEAVRALKQEPGGDLIVGGASLAASLVALGLVDEYQLYIHPVMIGRGTRMFPEGDSRLQNAELVDQHTFGSGVVFLHYRNASSA